MAVSVNSLGVDLGENCCRYSFIPRTVAEWNPNPATIREAPSVDTFKACLCNSFYQMQNCLITSAGRHARAPATVYPLRGDLIVVLDRNRKDVIAVHLEFFSEV